MHSLIIPAYNEESNIKKTIDEYVSYFNKRIPDYEIIVICDGTDKTAEIVKDLIKKNKKIKLIVSQRRLGKGGAVYKGFDAAKGSTIGFTDADEGVKPEDYFKLLKMLKAYGCAIASRRVKGAKIFKNRPFAVRIASIIFNKTVNFMFNLGIKDTQCGAKVLKKNTYNTIKDKLKLSFFEFDVELLWRLKQQGYKIKEVPITWAHGEKSRTYLRNSPRLFFSLIKLRFGL